MRCRLCTALYVVLASLVSLGTPTGAAPPTAQGLASSLSALSVAAPTTALSRQSDARASIALQPPSDGSALRGWQVVAGDNTLPGHFNKPHGVGLDNDGNVYVADTGNRRVQKLAPDGTPLTQWTLAPDSVGVATYPTGLTVDRAGFVHVSYDCGSDRCLHPGIQTFTADGEFLSRSDAGSRSLSDFALGGDGNFYVVDDLDRRVQRVSPDGQVLQQVGLRDTPPGFFKSPRALAVDRAGNVYVVDEVDDGSSRRHSRLQKLSPAGEPVTLWDRPRQFQSPRSIAADDAGNVYVAEQERLQKFSTTGELLVAWEGIPGETCPGGCFAAVAVDHAGNLYVRAPSNNQRVYKLSPDGAGFAPWGSSDWGPNATYGPCLGVDDANTVYVCSADRIYKLSANGELIGDINIGRTPQRIAVDRDGNIYAGMASTAAGSHSYYIPPHIWKFSPRGELLHSWDTHGSAPGELGGTFDLAIDGAGNLLIADAPNDRIQVLSPSGQPPTQWGDGGGTPGELRRPARVAVGGDGTVYVVDLEGQTLFQRSTADGSVWVERSPRIQRFTPDGEPLGPWDPIGANPGQLTHIAAVTVDRDGNLYLAAGGLVHKFSPDGNSVMQWGGLGSRPDMFRAVGGIAVDPEGNLFVADTDNNLVWKLSPAGEPIARWGSDIYEPVHIRVDDAGNLFILDAGRRWLQMRSPTGAVLAQQEIGNAEWDELTSGQVDADGNRYVTSVSQQQIEKRSPEGALLATWAAYIPAYDERSASENAVRATAQDNDGNVYVGLSINASCGCDAREVRIVRLRPSGEATTIVSRLGSDSTSNPQASSLLAGPEDTVYVVWDIPYGGSRVEMLSPTGESLAQWGGGGWQPGGFAGRASLALDPEGGLYVAEGGRIQRLPAVARDVPQNRYEHTATWTGTDVLIWGGQADRPNGPFIRFDGGARYGLRSGTWAPISRLGAPSPRTNHTAVWTGSEMLVWGGRDNQSHPFGDGARYDPSTNIWRPMSSLGAPSPRELHTAVWTGSEMIVWGGGSGPYTRFDDGARYDPLTDTWTPLPTGRGPGPRTGHTAVWTGTEMLVWGGTGAHDPGDPSLLGDGARYDPFTDRWRPISSIDAPSARSQFTAVWTGSEMLVWGGSAYFRLRNQLRSSRTLGDGARYSPTTDTWAPIAATDAPSPRWGHTMTWADGKVMIWGGSARADPGDSGPDYGSALGDGALYDPLLDAWSPPALHP